MLEALQYDGETLRVLDQLQLPYTLKYDEIASCEDGYDAIKTMRVRGAPLIAMVAALALAVELHNYLIAAQSSSAALGGDTPLLSLQQAQMYINKKLDYLVTSRPTAVNLQDCAQKLKDDIESAKVEPGMSPERLFKRYKQTAERFLAADMSDNRAIGEFGAEWIIKHSPASEPINVLTHCNTGSLATSAYGTALGVVRSLHAKGRIGKVYCTETRPYNQGSRLTAFELVHDQIDSCLITDSMAAALMQQRKISAVVVGADRVVRNGDTANKIGTYNLAIAAQYHHVPFLIAAPQTTIDTSTQTGSEIEIEERSRNELTTVSGPRCDDGNVETDSSSVRISIAAPGIDVWNPAFDVTPAALIAGIITEIGVVDRSAGGYDLSRLEVGPTRNGVSG
ncbi:MAG: S-methyl-5-thioribose-1-phosphate isomerase [Chrysothrix sp. TS-e1954]|nr:MAG: S-methyl-5-thioribose-1-phosphate isomerase [Chrysothrix sp. TS-e1954]